MDFRHDASACLLLPGTDKFPWRTVVDGLKNQDTLPRESISYIILLIWNKILCFFELYINDIDFYADGMERG